jgi:hypothetical protein
MSSKNAETSSNIWQHACCDLSAIRAQQLDHQMPHDELNQEEKLREKSKPVHSSALM